MQVCVVSLRERIIMHIVRLSTFTLISKKAFGTKRTCTSQWQNIVDAGFISTEPECTVHVP